MRKTSHDGVDTTSITSGTENELKKSSTTGIMKIKKTSIKRKVPNFSHESDDGIVEPLLQSDKEKSETAPRSAKYLLSKTKTDSISENEDSIKMSEINISHFSASTPSTSANKVITTINMNNVKDSNNVSNVTEVTTLRNHMNINIFCESETTKATISTKTPILVELDAAKTTGYNPSLIFTTAKIHSDCKTKLMEPVQVTPVPIISTIEKSVLASGSVTETKHEIKDVGNNATNADNNVFDSKGLSNDDKSNFEADIRNNSTSKAILNLTEKSTIAKYEQNMPKSASKNTIGNNILIETDTKNENFTTDLCNAKQISKDLNTKNTGQTNQMQCMTQPIKPKEETIEKSDTKDTNLPSSSIKIGKGQTNNEESDKKITVQGSKKLQRQKKATVEESQDTTSSTAKSPSAQISCSKSNYISKITSQSTISSKTPSQVGSTPKATDSKIKTPVSNDVTSQPIISSKIPSPVVLPEATDSNIQTVVNKNVISQSIASSKIPTQEKTIPKLPDSKIKTPVSKIPTPTTPVNNTITKSLTQTPASKTIQETGGIKTATSNKKGENLDPINKNESPFVAKLGAKEIAPSATEKSSPVPKTLPPYIVSTSKTKIGAPVVHSATLKSEANKLTSDYKSPRNSSYLVKTTPATSLITTTTSVPTPVATSATLKSEANKLASYSKSSTNPTYLVKTTPATTLITTTTSVPIPVATSATLKSEANKLASDSKSSTNSTYLVKTTPATSLKTTTSVPTPVATSATLKSDASKLESDSKSSTNSYLVKMTPATSLKTTTTSVPTTTPSSSQGTKQSVPVKQTKSNTEKQKGSSKA